MTKKDISLELLNIEDRMWEHEFDSNEPLYLSDDAFRASVKIFMTAMLTKMWKLQEKEQMPDDVREDMAKCCGTQVSELIKVYTGIDTKKLYNK